MTLCKAFDRHYKETSETLAWGTLKNYKTTLVYVKMFCVKILKQEDVYLKSLNYSFIQQMESFIPNNPLKGKKPCTRNGLMKHMERLKKISAWSIKMGWLTKEPFSNYKLKFVKKDPVFLELDELNRIENFVFQDPHIQYVADLFIFSCYTGLDYGDLLD
jgi:integrase/recombinase XerD